ncbi:MAG: hypothetical protein M3O62_14385 [Pseudomonadota bacterium]|nr:hypothetical protein [Pseudomonadota bacterium]
MSNRTTTSQQFRIQDVPEFRPLPCVKPTELTDAERSRLREHYARMIARFSSAAEQRSEDAKLVHRRFAKMMTTNTDYQLRAALSMLEQRQQLSGVEVAAIVSAAECGETPAAHVQTLIQNPELLPDAAVGTAIRDHVLQSDGRYLEALRKSL